jgi:hypothetical protein
MVTGEQLESMQACCDKLVLYKVFRKQENENGNGNEGENEKPRYYFSKPFVYHMSEFIPWLERNPKAKHKDDVTNMVLSLLVYFAVNRKLDQARKKQELTGDKRSLIFDDLYEEVFSIFDTMKDDDYEELVRMAQVVMTYANMQVDILLDKINRARE